MSKKFYSILIIFFFTFSLNVKSQVSTYTFSSSVGTYTSITGGTVISSGTFDDAAVATITIPSFVFNSITYTSAKVVSNGYMTFGATPPSSTEDIAISGSTAYSGAIAAFSCDLQNVSGSSEVRHETVGSEFVLQWKSVRRYAITEEISFQIRLNTSTNVIRIIYGGTITPGSSSTYPQVGLRGSTNADYNNRSITATPWSSSIVGTANTNSCYFNSTNSTYVPETGRTFIYTPCSGSAMTGTYTVGPTGNYASITEVKNALACRGVSGPVICELQTTYTDAPETYPITFNSVTGASGTNTITFRPVSGATSKVSDGDPGNGLSLFNFSAANYFIFDGRAGGAGTSQWTVQNTNSNATASNRGSAFKFISDASNNVLKYLIIEADANYNLGIIQFSTATSSGNDDNTISYCTIQNYSNTTYIPGSAIYSYGTSAKTNSGNIVEYSSFIDVFGSNQSSGTGNIDLDTYNSAWIIRYNDFFKNSATSLPTNTNTHAFIYIGDGGTYQILNNDLGGTAVDVGGGTKYTITGAGSFFPIYFYGSTTGLTNTVYSNKIANIDFTTTYTASSWLIFAAIKCSGAGTFNVGNTASETNTIGSTTVVGNILITNNAASTSIGYAAISLDGSGSSNLVNYNNIGGITLAGTKAAESHLIHIESSVGTVTISNNTLGSTVANNLVITSNSNFIPFACWGANTVTITNNTVQNIDHNATSAALYGLYRANAGLIFTGNTYTNIAVASTGACYMMYHAGTTATLSSNSINNITFENSTSSGFYGAYVNTASITTISSNTIGSSTNNNILLPGNATAYGIYKTGTGSCTMENNVIQEFYMSSIGTSSRFEGILFVNGLITSMTGNKIKNIDSDSRYVGWTMLGIENNSSTAGTHLIEKNVISNLHLLTTSAINNAMTGFYINAGSGNAKRNRVVGLTNNTTTTSSSIYGVYLPSGAWNFHNNVIISNNGAYTNDVYIFGFYDLSTSSSNYYQNTVKIYGQSTGSKFSSCYYRNASTGADIVKNNLFQNLRTNSNEPTNTESHYAMVFETSGRTAITSDYNYLETIDLTCAGFWGADYTLANWKVNVADPQENNSMTGTVNLYSNGSPPNSFTSNGTSLVGTVNNDFDGTLTRDATPWVGAYEGVSLLPIELVSFKGVKYGVNNNLIWETASELNNDFFSIEKTVDGVSFEVVGIENGAGTSLQTLDYILTDYKVRPIINYYRLKQTDFDGHSTLSEIIAIDNSVNVSSKEIIMKTNILGQEINEFYRGIVVIVYSDGSSVKVIQ